MRNYNFKNYLPEQKRWITMLILQEDARHVERIFANVAVDIKGELQAMFLFSKGQPTTNDVFTDWCYNPIAKNCIKTDSEESYHPIYYVLENRRDVTYEAFIYTRKVNEMTDEEKEHDPIVVHINLARFYSLSPRNKIWYLQQRLPGLLVHELGHASTMWDPDYEKKKNDNLNFGYTAVTLKNIKESGIELEHPDEVLPVVSKILYMMSPEENQRHLDQFDQEIYSLSNKQIRREITEFDCSDSEITIQFLRNHMRETNLLNNNIITELHRFMDGVTTKGDFTIPVLLTAFEIELNYLKYPDITDEMFWNCARDIIIAKREPTREELFMMKDAYDKFTEYYFDFCSKLYDITFDVLTEKGIFNNIKQEDFNFEELLRIYEDGNIRRLPKRHQYKASVHLETKTTLLSDQWTNTLVENDAVETFISIMKEMIEHKINVPEDKYYVFESLNEIPNDVYLNLNF